MIVLVSDTCLDMVTLDESALLIIKGGEKSRRFSVLQQCHFNQLKDVSISTNRCPFSFAITFALFSSEQDLTRKRGLYQTIQKK